MERIEFVNSDVDSRVVIHRVGGNALWDPCGLPTRMEHDSSI